MARRHKISDQKIISETAIAQHIKGLRMALKISAAKLDRLADFSPGTTQRLEHEEQNIYASDIYRICQATGVDIDYFYTCHTAEIPPSSPEEQEKIRLLKVYMRIQNNITKRTVFDLIETIADECEECFRK